MAKFNTDVVFIDGSGQVRVLNGDLTLRANPNGDGHIIVGSGISLRPDVNCDASDAIDLGQADLRWKTLFACSGNFLDRPTVNGSGVLLQGEAAAGGGVDSIKSLTGDVDLDSPDESVNIQTNGQNIEFTAPSGYAPSGASFILVDYNDNDHLTDARRLSATSGVTLDDQGARSGSGIVVKLDFDNEPGSGNLLAWNGFQLNWVDITSAPAVQVIRTTDFDLTFTFTNIVFDQTTLETNTKNLKHNTSSPERIDILVSGLYLLGFTGMLSSGPINTVHSRVLVNNTTVVSGTEYTSVLNDSFQQQHIYPFTYQSLAILNEGDFITQQFVTDEAVPFATIASGLTFHIYKLDGVAGASGTPGAKGEQGGAAGVDSIEGLSGIVNLDSSDNSIAINVDDQTINLTTAHTTIQDLSGIIDLNSPDGTVFVNVNGQTIELTVLPDEGQTSIRGLSGVVDITSPDGTVLISLNGQTIELTSPDEGQTSIEGLSGVVDLNSPDESININVNGQTVELTTPTSGAPSGASYILVDYNDNDHLTDARKLSAISGITLDDQGARSGSGIVIKLDFENEPTLNQILSWDGNGLVWVDDQTGGGGAGSVERQFSPASGTVFVVEHGLDTTAFVWSIWQTHEDEQDLDPILSMIPITVSPSGSDHAIINLDVAVSGVVTFVG